MGCSGWSAGGHWSNWILVNTDRFKAISSGAGTSNWISMYAQSDVQRNRQFYLGNKLPYDDFDAYWDQSPLKYIRNAKTPTMIHVVEGDPRVPSPQSVELHMALKKLGVPTELFHVPGQQPRHSRSPQPLVKSVSEMAWMDYYVRGTGREVQPGDDVLADRAFEVAANELPHVVVTDFWLRGGPSGADLCNRLKADERTRHIPTLMVTGSTQRNLAEGALSSGCAVVRLKPYLPDALERDVRSLLAGEPLPTMPEEHTRQ
jgi:CheY-like chemotaxis protein